MKWLLLILMAAAAAAIFIYRDELRGKVDANTSSGPSTPHEEVVDGIAVPAGSASGKKPRSTGPGTSSPDVGDRPPVKPTRPKDGGTGDDALAERYPMPKFKTIEEAVGNWKAIPPSAFPRQITISEAVKIVLPGGVGSSTIPGDSDVFALGGRGGILTVGKTVSASARGQIDIDQTNFKAVLGKEFDAWKERQQGIVMQQRARYRNVLAQTRPASPTSSSSPSTSSGAGQLDYEKELGEKPEQLTDGSVPLMVASLKRGDVSEITPDIIRSWGPVIREVVDGEAYWTASVEYETVSMFGELNTEAQALMRHGKVLKWIYTGSGESVP